MEAAAKLERPQDMHWEVWDQFLPLKREHRCPRPSQKSHKCHVPQGRGGGAKPNGNGIGPTAPVLVLARHPTLR